MANRKKKAAALIGAGMVARTHVSACAGAQETMWLKGIASRNVARARALVDEVASRFDPLPEVYGSVAEIAADPEVDFAILVTPPNVRAELIEPLAQAGKHILLEKPMGRNAQEAREIVQICKDAGVILGIVFQHRARSASQKAAEIIRSGQLGELGIVDISVPWWREQAYYEEPGRGTYARDGGGVLISQAIHTIDLALSLAGPVTSVTAMARTTRFHDMEAEDFVTAGLDFANGAVGALMASTASFPGHSESVTLHFDRGSLHLEAGQLRVSTRNGKTEVHGNEAKTGGGADPMAFTHDWHLSILENFLLTLNGKATPFASGEDALAVHDLIDATIRASRSRKTEVLKP